MPEPKVTLVYRPTDAVLSPGLRPGDTVAVPADEAERLIRSGAFQRPPKPKEPVEKEKP